MATVKTRPTNGVSYGLTHTITSTDVTDGNVIFDFRKGTADFRYPLVATVTVTSSAGVVATVTGLAITYPVNGEVEVAGTFTAGQIIHLIAQRDSSTITFE